MTFLNFYHFFDFDRWFLVRTWYANLFRPNFHQTGTKARFLFIIFLPEISWVNNYYACMKSPSDVFKCTQVKEQDISKLFNYKNWLTMYLFQHVNCISRTRKLHRKKQGSGNLILWFLEINKLPNNKTSFSTEHSISILESSLIDHKVAYSPLTKY